MRARDFVYLVNKVAPPAGGQAEEAAPDAPLAVQATLDARRCEGDGCLATGAWQLIEQANKNSVLTAMGETIDLADDGTISEIAYKVEEFEVLRSRRPLPQLRTTSRPSGAWSPAGEKRSHGFAGRIDLGYHQLLDDLARYGIASVRYEKFDRRAASVEEAEELLDFTALGQDAERWLDWLHQQPWAAGLPKILIGHSLGGRVGGCQG